MGFKLLTGKIVASSLGKVAIASVASITVGATAATAVTSTVYKKKINKIAPTAPVSASGEESTNASGQIPAGQEGATPSLYALEGMEVRVFDGVVQVWDGTTWNDYATVEEIQAQDPFYESEEKRASVELAVLNEKLAEAGIVQDENGDLVPIAEIADGENFVVGTITVERQDQPAANNNKKSNDNANANQQAIDQAALAQAQAQAAAQAAAAAQAQGQATPAPTWSDPGWSNNDSGGGGGDNGGGGGGSSDPAPAPSAPEPAPPAPEPTPPPADEGAGWTAEDI